MQEYADIRQTRPPEEFLPGDGSVLLKLVEPGGIEPPSDKGRPWKRYGRSFRFSVGSKLPETGFYRPSLLVFFPEPETLSEKHPPFLSFRPAAAAASEGNVAALRSQCVVVIVDVYVCVRV
jgi:hypothetical protein